MVYNSDYSYGHILRSQLIVRTNYLRIQDNVVFMYVLRVPLISYVLDKLSHISSYLVFSLFVMARLMYMSSMYRQFFLRSLKMAYSLCSED